MASRGRINTEELLRTVDIVGVIARHTKLKRAGRLYKGLCPYHRERTPSFTVYPATGGYHCFGCGANGDAIRFLMDQDGMTFVQACEHLASGDLPRISEEARVKAEEEDRAIREAAIAEAHAIWLDSMDLAGSLAQIYLRSRMISILPDRFRFAMCPAWYDRKTGEVGPDRPALVCCVTDEDDRFLGIQRVFLAPDGKGKATDMRNAKLSLGRPAGGAIRLGPQRGDHVIVIEGPEDGATVSEDTPDQPVWVACGTSMMPQIRFPAAVRRVTIGGDNNKAGRAAAQASWNNYQDRGLECRTVYPDPAFEDWNDQKRGIRRAA